MELFKERFKALIIDIVIVTLTVWVINAILYIPIVLLNISWLTSNYSLIVLVIVTLSYFTITEAKYNRTLGKSREHLYVSDEEGYMTYSKALIRNLSKIFWIPLIIDILLGMALKFPSRFLDKIAKTDVYSEEELELQE